MAYPIIGVLLIFGMLCTGIMLRNKKRDELVRQFIISPAQTPSDFNCHFDYEKTREGLSYLKSKKVIIAGLIRDAENNVPIMKLNIQKLASIFQDYCALIVENNSKDSTRKRLLEWSNVDPKIVVLGCGLNADVCELNLPAATYKQIDQKRIRKMALLRNIYMDYIKTNPELFDNFDFLIAFDFDITGTFYIDGIASAGYHFMENPETEGICANGIRLINFGLFTSTMYHDSYAHKEVAEHGGTSLIPVWHFASPKRYSIDSCDTEPRRVRSCFNGFTIYRLPSIAGKKYEYEVENNEVLCEHVAFNTQLHHVFLDPQLVFIIVDNK
jgi:hypothetical protein